MKDILGNGALAALGLFSMATARGEVSANAGVVSDYIFRGIPQHDLSISAGLDYETSGFYGGTWAADVGQGAEVDLYLGYGGQWGDLSYGVGATGYFYTGDFDDTYREINLSLGYSLLTLNADVGEYDNFGGPTQDYTHLAVTAEAKGFFATAGGFSQDFQGDYLEAGYGTDFRGFDFSISWIHSTSELLGRPSDDTIVLSVAKGFSLSE